MAVRYFSQWVDLEVAAEVAQVADSVALVAVVSEEVERVAGGKLVDWLIEGCKGSNLKNYSIL
jgi:hypothetical protein